jgi:hypothetical protein
MKRQAAVRLFGVVSLLLLALPMGSVAQVGQDSQYRIELKSREFVPSSGVEPALAQELAAAGDARWHALVQFEEIPNGAQLATLENSGVRLLAYIPNYAWLASLPATLNLQDPPLVPVRWMGAIQAADRTAPILSQPGVLQELADEKGQIDLDVRFFSDVDAGEAVGLLMAYGAVIKEKVVDFNRYEVGLDAGLLDAMAQEDTVQWIAPALPPKTTDNDGIRARTNVDIVHVSPYGLSGSGVDLGEWDGGAVDGHTDFGGRLTVVDGGAPVGDHATHVAGTMAGDGSNSASQGGSAFQWKGMAPGADILSYYWDNNLVDHDGAINTYGIELSQNSWSYTVDEGLFGNCWLYGNYDYGAPDYDDIITGLYGKRIVVVFSAGNERNDGDCGMSGVPPYLNYANVPPPPTAKNILAVGATNSNDDSMTTFSSWGPLDDGRLKPDIVAPGCETGSSIRSTFPGNTYGNMCGTSMAAPAVSGMSGLIIEQFRASIGGDPLPSTVKALLVQTAVDMDDGTSYYNPGPDYASGYGRVDVQAAADAIIAGNVQEDQVSNGQTDTFALDVPGGTSSLKVTLAWDDEPGAVNASPALVNNLNLILVEPNGITTHLPWVLNPASPSSNATTGTDNTNNVEQVEVNSPTAGTWQVQVVGSNVPVGPQWYSLVGGAFGGSGPGDVGPLVYDGHTVDDDNTGNSIGNSDGVVNPGETIELYVDLYNDGADPATDVYGILSTSDPYVTFPFNTGSGYGSIAGGAVGTNANDFDFEVSASTPNGHVIHFDVDITASNGGPWSDGFDLTVVGDGGSGNVALISDQTELAAITGVLDGMGLTYDVINNNWDGAQGIYTSDYAFLSGYAVVVWYASGAGYGKLTTQQEHDALEQYLQAGGRLLVTGYDTLGSPTDPLLADLVRSSSSGDGPFLTEYTITDGAHPITDGPYGSFPAGTVLTALHSDHDQAEADAGQGAHTVAELSDGHDKIMATELPSGGIVVYWNGNLDVSDWVAASSALQLGVQELKRDADGQPIGLPWRAQQTELPEGTFVVEGRLSDSPPAPAGASEGDGAQLPTGVRPASVVGINFDDAAQPCAFAATTALRNEYQAMGAQFSGPGANDGGAVLDQCGAFGVSGHSPPNFLAFNANSSLSDGGTPTDPEEIVFITPVSYVEIKAGSASGAGTPVTMEAFEAGGSSRGSDTITLGPALGTLSVSATGIARVVISSPAPVFVLDDLVFDTADPETDLLENTLHWLTQVPPPPSDPHEPNDTPGTCTPIFFDVPITDPTVDPAGDVNYYCFGGMAGQTIAADIDANQVGSPLDSVLTLFDSDGTTILIENDDYFSLDSYLEYPLPHDGTFFLRVRDYGTPHGGPDYFYSILLTDLTQPRSLPFFDDMESGANGWGADGLWHQVQDGVSPYPNSYSPTHSWWYGQDATGDYDTGAANTGNLTSPPIEIPPAVPAQLSFWQWYETEPFLLPQSVYFDVYHDTDGNDNISGGIYTDWATYLVGSGFSVVEYNQPIDLATLSGHQVLALFDPELALTAAEIAAINSFMLSGGRVVALGEWNDVDGVNTVLNVLSSAHGITFNSNSVLDSTNNDGADVWPLIYNYAEDPLVFGLGTTVMYAGCSLSLSGPAVPLATGDSDTSTSAALAGATEGAGETGIGFEGFLEPESIVPGAPVVMARAAVGDGELVAVGDSGLWTNEDPDGDGVISLDEYDGSQLAQRFFSREVDASSWDQKWVQVSVDGGPFTDLVQVTGGPMRAWHQTSVVLAPYAGSTVRLRFHFDTIDGALNAYRGWYVDDVLVDAQNPPNTPTNPSPADAATGVPVSADLSWTGGDPDPGDTVTYDVYFEADDSTPDLLLCNDVGTPTCDPGTLDEGTHYYWYVVATDNHGASTASPIWAFTTVCPLPAAPVLVAPADGSSLNDTRPNFEWLAVDGASAYRIQVDDNSGFSSPEIETETPDPAYEPTLPLPFGTYSWRVLASNSCGDGSWSPARSFTLVMRIYLPAVMKDLP